jgi:hypothetical protein
MSAVRYSIVAVSRLDAPLTDLRLPARMDYFSVDHGLVTVRDLVSLAPTDLVRQRNVGKRTVADTRAVLEHFLGATWEQVHGELRHANDPLAASVERDIETEARERAARLQREKEAWDAAEAASRRTRWIASFREAVRSLPRRESIVVARRAGLDGPVMMLDEIRAELGDISGQRVGQIGEEGVARLRSSGLWLHFFETRLGEHLKDGVVSVRDLGALDALLEVRKDEEDAFSFVATELLRSSVTRVWFEDRPLLSRYSKEQFQERVVAVRRAARRLGFPIAEERLREALVTQLGWPPDAVRPFARLIDAAWTRRAGRVLGFGAARRDAATALARTVEGPVRVADVKRTLGGAAVYRGLRRGELLLVDRGVVDVPEHVADWRAWADRLAPMCRRVMTRRGPGRQWSTAELLACLARVAELPPWCNEWSLGSLLRGRREVAYLGRNMVALPAVGKSRRQLRAIAVEVLERADAPVPTRELFERMARVRAVHGQTFNALLRQSPLVLVTEGLVGLAPRDIPGGEEASARAIRLSVGALHAEGGALQVAYLHTLLVDLGAPFDRWTPSLVSSVVRGDARFRVMRDKMVRLREGRADPHSSSSLPEDEGEISRESG